ncbi:exopolysaccharide biosynthesis protein, WecB/TagA/CpsF family [Sphaerochaeta pleomorpha str. Grapes]|uniref:Exopolysaccharide biosynthesis protein, WecB/TagA/CpsF family n=1 Tax=Sphaerochaeta pleomorpha (strain ATCC BAA-1885 / DSM 22778 / Grapes) TaxID=158190 RepID=G8QSA4_SPHPG|nr:WecB/TagA/CpsF family glycosyltransferase [Sphaerochaeta pleomorpha]AEV30034.1 exopolysaccharide biosynthesis protein, WecB/TagA/CpsF family [Sphaerochaeta pleomorpha str. Grapes]
MDKTNPGIFFLLGIPILNITMAEALDLLFSSLTDQKETKEIHFVNAHCINVAAKQNDYLAILKNAEAIFPDGTGIRKAGEALKNPIIDNVNGTDMFPLLCERCAQEGKTIYLLGAGPSIAEKAAHWANAHAKKDIIAGFHDGFFSKDEEKGIVEAINASKADILLLAMGVPRQELWIHAQKNLLTVPVAMGVGGLFDFYSGSISRAPSWMRKTGIEWVWRLLMEPKRMWKRYIIGNAEFLLRINKIKRNRKKANNQ